MYRLGACGCDSASVDAAQPRADYGDDGGGGSRDPRPPTSVGSCHCPLLQHPLTLTLYVLLCSSGSGKPSRVLPLSPSHLPAIFPQYNQHNDIQRRRPAIAATSSNTAITDSAKAAFSLTLKLRGWMRLALLTLPMGEPATVYHHQQHRHREPRTNC